MIKFLTTTIGVLVATVGFLYYLIHNVNFVPVDISGDYLITNIVVLFFLLFVALSCIGILIIFGIRKILFKQIDNKANVRISIRYGLLLSFGILLVYLLHFFHILSFIWGLAILVVVILSLFVI